MNWKVLGVKLLLFRPAGAKELKEDPNRPVRRMNPTFKLSFAHRAEPEQMFYITLQNRNGTDYYNLTDPDGTTSGGMTEETFYRVTLLGRVKDPNFVEWCRAAMRKAVAADDAALKERAAKRAAKEEAKNRKVGVEVRAGRNNG